MDRYIYGGNTPHKETYKAINEIKVASGEKVYEELIKRIGDKKISDYDFKTDETRVLVNKYKK